MYNYRHKYKGISTCRFTYGFSEPDKIILLNVGKVVFETPGGKKVNKQSTNLL